MQTGSHGSQRGRLGKLAMKRSQSHDASTQMEELEGDVYKAIAGRRSTRNTEREEKGKSGEKKQKRRSGTSDHSVHDKTGLPPLQHVVKHQRPRSRSVGGADHAMDSRVSDQRREKRYS